MNTPDPLIGNRVILCHFDSYSAALVFAHWGDTLLAPGALPDAAVPMEAPAEIGAAHDGAAVMAAAVARYGLNPNDLVRLADFDAWMDTDAGPLRVHALRFTTFEAPAAAIGAHGGSFKHIAQLRGGAMLELNLLRQVFNLMVGGSR